MHNKGGQHNHALNNIEMESFSDLCFTMKQIAL